MARSLADISSEIYSDWKKVSPHAAPYLEAMSSLESIDDKYGLDSGSSIVSYFLSNAQSWKGEKAKEIKKELNAMLKENEEFSNDESSIMEIYENGQVLSFEQYELIESLNETAGLEVEVETETPEEIVVRINGGIYTYKDSGKGVDGKGEPIPFSEVVRKFKKMKQYSDGRALQYLIKNTKMTNKKKVEKEDAKV